MPAESLGRRGGLSVAVAVAVVAAAAVVEKGGGLVMGAHGGGGGTRAAQCGMLGVSGPQCASGGAMRRLGGRPCEWMGGSSARSWPAPMLRQ